MKRTKRLLIYSLIALLSCVVMLAGTTYAWFTDSVTSSGNVIKSGNLDVEMHWSDDMATWTNVEESDEPIFGYDNWEPGHTEIRYIKIVNAGSLAFKYKMNVIPVGQVGILAEVIDVYYGENVSSAIDTRGGLGGLSTAHGTLAELIENKTVTSGALLPKGEIDPVLKSGETVIAVAFKMQESAGNKYQKQSIGDGFTIQLVATQYGYEEDDFGPDYDGNVDFPELKLPGQISTGVTPDANGKVPAGGVSMESEDGTIGAVVNEGTQLDANVNTLTLSITEMDESSSNIQLGGNEILRSLDVHVEGVSEANTVPVIISIEQALIPGLNMGNYKLYHVENGVSVEMTLVPSLAELDAHNEFTYDPVTGDVVLAMATFSEVAMIADTENAWEGNYDYSWYTNAVTTYSESVTADYVIANADQLAAFGAIVGGMNGQTQDSFTGKTVKLVANINLGDKESENNPDIIFYPIGYYNGTGSYEKVSGGEVTSNVNSFEGTFDGNGHTISNFYQNTWEMFGDYNSGYSGTPNHYKDAMGLFGYVVNGAVKNLTVDNFSSDGEFTPTGVIAAYAVNSTFENIAITKCNPRVYNTGNGGIVGIGGNSDDPDYYKLTFNNITIDNTNKITALWGSWDVACGGLVGMFRGDGHVHMTNCHVAAQMDVYNDVCGNYQYYWYRYSGMMVGTNKNMTTDANGYTVPETDKFHAENCTVHFGEWNDYYYCELVANSIASYTHDHQFSRLTEISSLDEIKSGDTWTKTGNFLLISGDTKTCYHIVNKDGELTRHEHADAGEETVNGTTVLKEDKQIVYLPFNQLFTGYGWGVKHIPVYNGEDCAFAGITILDREVADSVVKFEQADTAKDSYTTGTIVTIGELFAVVENAGVDINTDAIIVSVSPVGENSDANGTYTANTDDWTNGTIEFSGIGAATITITDYYFCTPTTINVNVIEPVAVEKFESKFTGEFLYRVGNQNTVSLGNLFVANDGADIGTVSVTVEALNGVTASGVYTENTSDWTKGTIQFSGTGPVKVTITDNYYCIPTELILEVVDATNVTTYSGLGNRNSVLLNDITMSSGGSYYLSGATLYGNGFTFDMTNGAYAAPGNASSSYVFLLNNANIDNVQIVGAVYTQYGATVNDNYNRAAVLSTGNNTIVNSYISNCASAVRVNGGNLEIVNSTIKGGNFANVDIRNGHVILDNVTTINQVNGNDTATDGTVVVGFGVVVYYENVLDTTTIEVRNGIAQYNVLSKTQANAYIQDTKAQSLVNVIYGNNDLSSIRYTENGELWVNAGILSMTDTVGDDNITDIDGYVNASTSMTGVTGYLHTKIPDATSISAIAPDYETAGQGAIAPAYTFDYTTKNYVAKDGDSNDYCYEENGIVYISMDEGDTFNWDASILAATKNSQTLSYTVSMNGTDYTGKNIAFNTAGNYEVIYTYTDSNNYGIDENCNIVTYDKTYTKTVHISVSIVTDSTKYAEFTMGSSNAATEKIIVGNNTYISATGVAHNNSAWSYITVDGKQVYYPIVEATIVDKKIAYFNVFKNVVSITDYPNGAAVTYNSVTTTMPSGLTVVKGTYKTFADISSNWSTLNDSSLGYTGASNVFKYAGSASAASTPTTYSGALCFASPEVTNPRDEYITIAQYSYTDNAGKVYYYYVGYHLAEKGDGACIAPDTLVTLADGSQVRVDSLNGDEMLLVWNLETGKLDSAPIMFVDSEEEAVREVVKLKFSDNTEVKVIYEHGFWDYDLNKYVYLDSNAENYIGHTFAKQDGENLVKVELVDVEIESVVTSAWSPVTVGHLCYFVNGMLSMPGGVSGLFNVFEVDTETMTYDYEAMQVDIETYGLYTYEELNAIVPLSEEMFNAAGGAYLKISIGKGNMTEEDLIYMINRYSEYFN